MDEIARREEEIEVPVMALVDPSDHSIHLELARMLQEVTQVLVSIGLPSDQLEQTALEINAEKYTDYINHMFTNEDMLEDLHVTLDNLSVAVNNFKVSF